jgi:hypothetical protein
MGPLDHRPEPPPVRPFSRNDLAYLGLLTAAALALGLVGIWHYGYMGQDFLTHRTLILGFPGAYTYNLTNPPGLYWLGSLIRHRLAPQHYQEALALVFQVLNAAALWILYGFLWRGIGRWQIRYAAAAFITFVPFRVIHSTVIAADALTIPLFAAVALFTLRLYADPRRVGSWLALCASLCAGMACKYSFAGLEPAVLLLLVVAIFWRVESGKRAPWAAALVVALAVPTGIFLNEMGQSFRVKGPITNQQWLPAGVASRMRWRDMLLLKGGDTRLFDAPDYIGGKLYAFRNFSYLGLLHEASVTDPLNLFQTAPEPIRSLKWAARTQDDFLKHRGSLSQELQAWSVRLGLGFSLLALAGTATCAVLGLRTLLGARRFLPDSTVVLTALAVAFYLPIFLSLPRIGDPYTAGFWLPRLVLPALLVFFGLGFVLADRACGRVKGDAVFHAFLGYTCVVCVIFIGFLA